MLHSLKEEHQTKNPLLAWKFQTN